MSMNDTRAWFTQAWLIDALQNMRTFVSLGEYDGAQDYLVDVTYYLAQLVQLQNEGNK